MVCLRVCAFKEPNAPTRQRVNTPTPLLIHSAFFDVGLDQIHQPVQGIRQLVVAALQQTVPHRGQIHPLADDQLREAVGQMAPAVPRRFVVLAQNGDEELRMLDLSLEHDVIVCA